MVGLDANLPGREIRSRFCAIKNRWRGLERAFMKTYDSVIEGTAREVIAELANAPPDEFVRVMVGRPSLSVMASRLQAAAAANGMTADIHDNLLRSIKNDG